MMPAGGGPTLPSHYLRAVLEPPSLRSLLLGSFASAFFAQPNFR